MSVLQDAQGAEDIPSATLLPCPICRSLLTCDTSLVTTRWRCQFGHSFTNTGTLLAEIQAADQQTVPGTASPRLPHPQRKLHPGWADDADWSADGDWENGLVGDVLAAQPWWRDAASADGHEAVS